MQKFLICLITSTVLFSASVHAEKIKIALNWKPEPEFGGFYAAQVEGDFARHGLEVEIIPGGSGQPVPQMVAAGQVDYGISSADEIVISRARGANTVALFAVYQTNPQGIMVHASLGAQSLDQVFKKSFKKPLTLAIEKGFPFATFLNRKYGFSKVKIVPYSGGIGTFLNQPFFAQQCYVTSEPLAALRSKSDPRSFLIADAGYNPYATVLATRGDRITKDKDQVKRVVEAVREGWEHYLKDPTRTNLKMHELNAALDIATYDAAARVQAPLITAKDSKESKLGDMIARRWQRLISQLIELKVIEKPIKAEECFQNF